MPWICIDNNNIIWSYSVSMGRTPLQGASLDVTSPGLKHLGYSVRPLRGHCSLDIYSFVFRDSAPKARYQDSLVHRIISKRPTVGFKRVWMRGVSEEHIRCDT